jgi:hypothetical protein
MREAEAPLPITTNDVISQMTAATQVTEISPIFDQRRIDFF